MITRLIPAVLGAILGVGVGLSGLDPFGATGALHELGRRTTHAVIGPLPVTENWRVMVSLLAGALLPGLVSVLLAHALNAGVGARRMVSITLVVGAAGSFMILDPVAAAVLLAVAFALAVVLGVTSALLTSAVAFVWGLCSLAYVTSVVEGTDSHLSDYAGKLGASIGMSDWWPATLAVLAVAPVAGAALIVLRRR